MSDCSTLADRIQALKADLADRYGPRATNPALGGDVLVSTFEAFATWARGANVSLEDAMAAASSAITDDELERALARHPRIGERADCDTELCWICAG